jgi:RNA ligase (TIGR02306 family)
MSEFRVEVVQVGSLEKHPNADTLSITKVYDYPVIVKTGEFNPGDKAVYIPIDAIVPDNDPRFDFLGSNKRIKAKRLRGTFSMGLLIKADPNLEIGQDVADIIGIKKWEPKETTTTGGDNERCPFFFPVYTDIENYRRWPDVLQEWEPVIITEKIHGCNARFVYHKDRLWCGSRTGIKKQDPTSLWWKAANIHNLEERLKSIPGIVLYGEVFGQVQDLKYGAEKNDLFFAVFDAMDINTGKYLGWGETERLANLVDLPLVPILYKGMWDKDLLKLCEGKSTLADHIREGCVIKPLQERFDDKLGRVILKVVSEAYLLRKDGTEFH